MIVEVLEIVDALEFECNSCHTIPSLQLRESLEVGQVLQLILSIEDGASNGVEKVWVELMEIDKPYYIGKLLDPSTISPNLLTGHKLHFVASQVFQVYL